MSRDTALVYDTDSFKWSKEEYSLTEVLDRFAHQIPFAFIVTQGYSGKEDVGADEMYYLHGLVFQPRVVGRDTNDDYLSIPLCYSEKVIPATAAGEEGPLMTVDEMVRKNVYRTFRFLPRTRHTIIKDASELGVTELEPMEIIKTYDERFLAVHCLLGAPMEAPFDRYAPRKYNYIQEGVHPTFALLPVYMPIAIALGLDVCEDDTENFHRTMYDLKVYVDKQSHNYETALKAVADIMVFDEAPSDGDYEYIHILHFIKSSTQPGTMSPSGPALPRRETPSVPASAPRTTLQNPTAKGAPPRPPKTAKNIKMIEPSKPKTGIQHLKKNVPQFPPSVTQKQVPMKIEDSDSDDYEEIPDEKAYSNVTTTQLSSRVGPLAMDLVPEDVLSELHKLFTSGTVPTSTRKPRTPKPKESTISAMTSPTVTSQMIKFPLSKRKPPDPPPGAHLVDNSQTQSQTVNSTPQKMTVQTPQPRTNRPPPDKPITSPKRVPESPSLSDLSPGAPVIENSQKQSPTVNSKPQRMAVQTPPPRTNRPPPDKPITSPKRVSGSPSLSDQTSGKQKPMKEDITSARLKAVHKNTTSDSKPNLPKAAKFSTKVIPASIVDSSQIPENVSDFTVGDVAKCLELLQMSEYIDRFLDQQIDGDMLQQLDEAILKDDFGLSAVGARKIVRFVKGWRPKLN